MCVPGLDPITLAGIAASGAGALMNRNMQNDAVDETNRQNRIAMDIERKATEDERARQMALERQQADQVAKALFEVDPTKTAAEIEEAAPTSEIATIADDYIVPKLQGQLSDGVTAERIGEIITGSTEKLRKVLTAASVLSQQGVATRGNQDELVRLGSENATTGSFRQGSLNASQKEKSIPAAEVTASSSPLGDLIMLAGQGIAGKRASKTAQNSRIPPSPNTFGTGLTLY
jgi:hypothetical protein